ncbi:hypothetical protein EDD85DRAFT_783180 [Armillaria nabsnona]|nr:hypothetical protein EDD85DRAFT_783180 [Armillaria nabsnona]
MLSHYFVLFLISAGRAFAISAPPTGGPSASLPIPPTTSEPSASLSIQTRETSASSPIQTIPSTSSDSPPIQTTPSTTGTSPPIQTTSSTTGSSPPIQATSSTTRISLPIQTTPSEPSAIPPISISIFLGPHVASSVSISSTVPIPSSSTIRDVQPPTSSGSGLQPISTSAGLVAAFSVITTTGSSSSLSTTPLSPVAQTPVDAGTSKQTISFHSILESTSVAATLRVIELFTDTSTDLPTFAVLTSPTSLISSNPPRNHVPQIIGGTLGSFLFIILLIAFFIFFRRRHLRPSSSQSSDIEKRKESETPSRPDSMDQPLTRPESHASILTSAYSPLSQHTFYLSHMDGFLQRPDSDPHRHERDPSVASSNASHLTSRQFLLHERVGSLRDEADWLRQTISSSPANNRIIEELQTTIRRLEEQVQRLEAEHESDWALYQSDEPPPAYMEVISRSQSNS